MAIEALKQCPGVKVGLVSDGPADGAGVLNLDEAVKGCPTTPVADESLGMAMLYSSGTAGRPKGILRPLPEQSPAQVIPAYKFLMEMWRLRDGMTYL